MKFKKFKLFKSTSVYEKEANFSKYIHLLFDKDRTYYGIIFAIDKKKVYYGDMVCENTGVEYKGNYTIRKIYRFTIYHYVKWNNIWKEKGWKPRWLNLSVQEVKKKV